MKNESENILDGLTLANGKEEVEEVAADEVPASKVKDEAEGDAE